MQYLIYSHFWHYSSVNDNTVLVFHLLCNQNQLSLTFLTDAMTHILNWNVFWYKLCAPLSFIFLSHYFRSEDQNKGILGLACQQHVSNWKQNSCSFTHWLSFHIPAFAVNKAASRSNSFPFSRLNTVASVEFINWCIALLRSLQRFTAYTI